MRGKGRVARILVFGLKYMKIKMILLIFADNHKQKQQKFNHIKVMLISLQFQFFSEFSHKQQPHSFQFTHLAQVHLQCYKLCLSGNSLQLHKYNPIAMDSKNPLVSELNGDDFYIAQFKTNELAIFSYYIQSHKECLLIDPIFNVKEYLDFIAKRHATLKFVLLSHYHADYISGHNEFKMPIVMGPQALRAINKFKVKEAKDGELLHLGNCKVKVLHTPGHTLESSCYLLKDVHEKDVALFTGDTVFLGDVGRPDLTVSSSITKEDLAGLLFDSVQRLRALPDELRIYPGHGSGSSCGKAIGAGNFCTLGEQMKKNYGFKLTDKKEFIKELTANMPKPPEYFFFDAHTNQTGPTHYNNAFKKAYVGLTIQDFTKFSSIIKTIDTRKEVGAGIIRGSYWLPESGPIANFISNFVSPTDEFLLITDVGKSSEVMERLFRIGYHNIKGYNSFDLTQLKQDFVKPTILKFITMKHIDNGEHLDVRNVAEYRSTGVINGAILIPLRELESRIKELKGKKNITINCLSGLRSKIAFSVLAKYGIESRVLAEEFKEFRNNGLNIVEYKE